MSEASGLFVPYVHSGGRFGDLDGQRRWCKNGECTSWGSEKVKVVKGGWSAWDKGECKSGCIKKSRAVILDKRYCDNPKPKNTEKYCEGDNVRIHFCDDSKLCKKLRNSSRLCKTEMPIFQNMRSQFEASQGARPRDPMSRHRLLLSKQILPTSTSERQSAITCGHQPRGLDPEVDVPLLNNAHPKGENRAPKKLQEYSQYKEGRLPPLPGPDDLGRPKGRGL
ncbi:a disintegrin and metalloproteinase with thrombospondin motifs 16 [Caerostris extrusa]|uniref:A disintegrin and metalloproteinase with thrombospondin motifs 16 n=1 Tax=Caerostris extrusa TaxID=172846 RepID=A0AAV4NV44_CAEEX|nr:a disintegrin and metalloproteinase with thrombospondin motifs 16 [Caerostris extrusa]